jgi:16S rRNA (cytosine967-C5)-methyltransferase
MPVSSARAAAFGILLRVERDSSYASELLHSPTYEKLSVPDHALATELVMGVLRWQSRLDNSIAQASSQPLKKLDLEVLIALRIAVYQFGWLTRIPARAALHESVELVKRARKSSAAAFVNAVLRKLSNLPLYVPVSPVVKDCPPQALGESYAHPLWLIEHWTKQYGLEAAQKICQHNQTIPETTLRLRSPNAETDLAAHGISLAPGHFLTSARRLISGDVTKTEPFLAGRAVIQDEGSQIVAALIGSGHEQILDCCAAPGGKTLSIADQNLGAAITAVEIHPHRARLLRKLVREDAQRIRILTADARHLPLTQQFDRILVDAPCSGTGTLARNPEIKWRLRPQDLGELQERQVAILRSATQHLKPGGQVIYSTCSLEKEENEDVVEKLLNDDPRLHRRDCREELNHLKTTGVLTGADPISLTRGPYLRTIPGVHPCDGFFAALLELG